MKPTHSLIAVVEIFGLLNIRAFIGDVRKVIGLRALLPMGTLTQISRMHSNKIALSVNTKIIARTPHWNRSLRFLQ